MDDMLFDGFARALRGLCTDDTLRAHERGAPDPTLWNSVDSLGFTDGLIGTARGGAGLGLSEFFPLLFEAGRIGLGLPFGETAVARALLADAGQGELAGTGPIAIAPAAERRGQALVCRELPGAACAGQVLVEDGGMWLLLSTEEARPSPGRWRPRASATWSWERVASRTQGLATHGLGAVPWCNALHAAGMAGAMSRVLDLCVDYARERSQFGRPIGQFQAIQQELSVMAEQVHSATLAARLGCAGEGWRPDPLLAASAKLRACEAAAQVARIAHAVLGAIGITEEHVLGLYTRRLHEWRDTPGTETECAQAIGEALIAQPADMLDFVRSRLSLPGSLPA